MAKLGEYIHLTWQGYQNSGVEWDDGSKVNDLTTEIFDMHKQNILKKAKETLYVPNLKELQDDYNKRLQENMEYMKKAVDNMNELERFNWFKAIALSSHFSNDDAEIIAKDMEIDPIYGIKYNPKNPSNHILRKGRITVANFPSKVKISTADGKTQKIVKNLFHYRTTVIKKIKEAIVKVQNLEAIDISIRKSICTDLGNIIRNINEAVATGAELDAINKKLGYAITAPIISHETANKILEQVRGILRKASSIDAINRDLAAYWAENEGMIIADKVALIGFSRAQEVIEGLANKTLKSTGSTMSNVRVTVDMLTSGKIFEQRIKELETRIKQETQSTKQTYEIDTGGEKTLVHYDLFRNYSVQQKADIEYIFNESKIGISMKSTDLSATKYMRNGELKLATVDLQGATSLLLYLAGLEQMTSTLGTHYLNILADHGEENADDSIYQHALDSLALSLTYSALTGELQNREGGLNATILAVRDKAINKDLNRVKLFDMSVILDLVAKNGFTNNIIFSPSLDKIQLDNVKIIEDKDEGAKAQWLAARRRCANVIAEARLQTISIGITKQLLNSIIRSRGY